MGNAQCECLIYCKAPTVSSCYQLEKARLPERSAKRFRVSEIPNLKIVLIEQVGKTYGPQLGLHF